MYETSSEEEDGDSTEVSNSQTSKGDVVDLEDLGKVMKKMKTAKVRQIYT